jgi:hypothetical protein
VVVLGSRKTPWQQAGVMGIDQRDRGHRLGIPDLPLGLYQPVANQIPNGLGAIRVCPSVHPRIQAIQQPPVHRHTEPV